MRITDPHQTYVDQGKQFDSYEAFFESLHECLKCGRLFDDSADMSKDIDVCKDCADPKAAPPPGVRAIVGVLKMLEEAMSILEGDTEIKEHLKQGEQ